jgi:integrase
MSQRFTASFIRRVVFDVPPSRDTTYADSQLERHFLRVQPPHRPGESWPAYFGIRPTLSDGRTPKIKIADARVTDPDAAREQARERLALIDAGGDLRPDRTALRAAWSVKDLWAAYQDSSDFKRAAPKSQAATAGAFVNHIINRIGAEKLKDVDVPMVKRLGAAISTDTRTNARKRHMGGEGAVRKVTRALSAALTWAVGQGRLDRNPLIGGLRLTGDNARETVITSPAEYVALLRAMDAMVTAGTLRAQSRVFFIVAAYTGMRRSELQRLRWGQVDLTARRIILPKTKGGRLARSGVRTETVSLPPLAASALAEIAPADAAPDDKVFVPRQGEAVEVNRDWVRVRDHAGLPKELGLHGLRHSIGTVSVIAGLSAPEVQKLLRHRNITTTAKYVHLAEAVQSRLQDRATAHLQPDDPDLTHQCDCLQ